MQATATELHGAKKKAFPAEGAHHAKDQLANPLNQTPSMKDVIIACVGKPSAGKSSFLNAGMPGVTWAIVNTSTRNWLTE